MIDRGKQNVLGVLVDAVDYEGAVKRVMTAAQAGQGLAATALAVHGVMTGVGDKAHRYRLNHFDLVTPDGQPVRWALNLLHGSKLPDRVYGPNLTLEICKAAAQQGVPLYFYGSRQEVLDKLTKIWKRSFRGSLLLGRSPLSFGRAALRRSKLSPSASALPVPRLPS